MSSSLHPAKRKLAAVILVGGTLVILSYVHGIITHPNTRGDVWGGVPVSIQPLYTITMVLAAVGFFFFTGFIFFCLDPKNTLVAGRYGFGIFPCIYLFILIPSAVWMPLTFAMLETSALGLWLAIRADLFLVGAASLSLFPALLTLGSVKRGWPFALAILGLTFFCLQTALLDAIVWPAYFPFPAG